MPSAIKPAKTPELAAAETVVQQRLATFDFEGAARAVAAYESRQPVPRGMGIDWARRDLSGDIVALRSIYGATASDSVRQAAAQMFLWGVSRPYRRWLAAELGGDAQATTLVLAAYKAQQALNDEQAHRLYGHTLRRAP